MTWPKAFTTVAVVGILASVGGITLNNAIELAQVAHVENTERITACVQAGGTWIDINNDCIGQEIN